MAKGKKTFGGVNVEFTSRFSYLDLTLHNTTAPLFMTLAQVERFQRILALGAAALKQFQRTVKPGRTPKLQLNVKLGTRQKRIFVPNIVWRPQKSTLEPDM